MCPDHDHPQKSVYQIVIQGVLEPHWTRWLNNMEATTAYDAAGKPVTVLQGPISDQSELRGLMTKIWDLNMTLISIIKLDTQDKKG